MLADREFDEAVPKALQLTLDFVHAEGTANKMEWLHQRYAHFLHHTFTVDIGEADAFRRIYALTYVVISENRDDIARAASAIGAVIETDYS